MIVELSLAGEAPAWYILELQGTLHSVSEHTSSSSSSSSSPSSSASPFAGLVLGDIAPRAGSKNGVTLHIGSNRLAGAIEPLPAPLVVLRRQTVAEAAAAGGADADEMADADGGDGGGAGADAVDSAAALPSARFVVAAVVRHRIRFTERPQPVIGATSSAAASAAAATAAGGGGGGGGAPSSASRRGSAASAGRER